MTIANKSAFPVSPNSEYAHPDWYGLTKREYFAGLAMQGLLAHTGSFGEPGSPGVLANRSVEMADALIAELNKKES